MKKIEKPYIYENETEIIECSVCGSTNEVIFQKEIATIEGDKILFYCYDTLYSRFIHSNYATFQEFISQEGYELIK
jgi:hypothetical protein